MKYFNWLIFIIIISAVTYLSVIRINMQSEPFTYADLVAHFLMYGVMAFFLYRADHLKPFWVIVIVASYGGLIEVVQNFIPYRDMSLLDGMANLAGAIAGTFLWSYYDSRISRKKA